MFIFLNLLKSIIAITLPQCYSLVRTWISGVADYRSWFLHWLIGRFYRSDFGADNDIAAFTMVVILLAHNVTRYWWLRRELSKGVIDRGFAELEINWLLMQLVFQWLFTNVMIEVSKVINRLHGINYHRILLRKSGAVFDQVLFLRL